MTTRLKIFSFAAGLHLLLAALSAAHFAEWGFVSRKVSDPLHQWGEFTGSSNIYSFFAPFVGEQVSVLYTLADSNLLHQHTWMLEGRTHESHTRVTTMYNFLGMEEASEAFCRSFGNNALRLHPEATFARVSVIRQTMPKLEIARLTGAVPRWEPLFSHDYQRK